MLFLSQLATLRIELKDKQAAHENEIAVLYACVCACVCIHVFMRIRTHTLMRSHRYHMNQSFAPQVLTTRLAAAMAKSETMFKDLEAIKSVAQIDRYDTVAQYFG